VYEYLKEFDYFLRLDDDSFLDSPIRYDLFSFMKERSLVYGYIHAENEYHAQTLATLPTFTHDYIVKNNIKIMCAPAEINALYYYSNFTITEVSFWRRLEVQNYLTEVDESLGIYNYRWGDHIVQTLALKMFCDPQQIYYFQDFKYSHGSHGWANYQRKSYGVPGESIRKRVMKRLSRIYLGTMLKVVNR
jgi:hypothetical protein